MLNIHIAQTVSEKEYNEDVFTYGDDYAMVLDGASGLDHANRMQTGSDARWFVLEMMKEIEKNIHKDLPLKSIVKDAIETLMPLYPVVEKNCMPSGCLSLIRLRNHTVEYMGFGDSVLMIQTKDGCECIYDHKIEELDHMALHAENRLSILLNNRNLRNVQGGYCALDLTLSSLDYCIEKSWPVSKVQSVALMSDGFYQLKEFLKQDTAAFLQTLLEQKEKALPLLHSLQEQDWPCLQLPRLKKRDDTTVLFFTL